MPWTLPVAVRSLDYAGMRLGPSPPTPEQFRREFERLLYQHATGPRKAFADHVVQALDYAAAQGWGRWL